MIKRWENKLQAAEESFSHFDDSVRKSQSFITALGA
jgi:hypothetical protein